MDDHEFKRLFRLAKRLYAQTADGEDHGFTAVMDELVMECDDEQWNKVAAAVDLEEPSQTSWEAGKVNEH